MLSALDRLQLIEIVIHDFRGRLDNGQRRAEFVRYHRHKFTPQLPQLLFSCQRPEQFGLGLLALRDVQTDDENVGFTIDLNDVGRLQQCVDCTPPGAKLALDLAQRTVAMKIRQESTTIIEIQPNAQLLGVVTNNSVTTQTKPTYERIVCLDKLCIAQPQNRNIQRAGAKGRAEARLTFPQPRLALAQFLFGAFAHCDVVADGLNKLSAAELDGCKKHFDGHFGTVAA